MRALIAFSFLCCFASLCGENKTEPKIYLGHDQVAIHDNQLFVCIDNQWVTTPALFSDAKGMYVDGRKWYEPWECSYCGAPNPPYRLTCWSCKR